MRLVGHLILLAGAIDQHITLGTPCVVPGVLCFVMDDLRDELLKKTQELMALIEHDREEMLRAWMAQHPGIMPSEAVLVQRVMHSEGALLHYESYVRMKDERDR